MNKNATIALCLLGIVNFGLRVEAGNLEPPGPPAPTMKTLDEVEPRIPVHASDLPLTISAPGSYYLAEEITAAGDGISIEADDVSIDLMGYSLVGGTGDGIKATAGTRNLTVKNGTIAGWSKDGIDFEQSANSQVLHVRVENNGSAGIRGGDDGLVKDCTALENHYGILVRSNSTVSRSIASANSFRGIGASWGSLVVECTARQNYLEGIAVAQSSVVNSVAYDNIGHGIWVNGGSVIGCTANGNGNDGISVTSAGAWVSDSQAADNGDDGIQVAGDSTVMGNNCQSNGADQNGAGIYVGGSNNRIESNNVAENYLGIDVIGSGNVILKNTARGSTGVGSPSANYDIGPNNSYGPIVDVGSVGDITAVSKADHPWANFEY